MPSLIQFRRGTSSEWSSANPILMDGELGLETDTRAYKVGNGVSAWNALGYYELSGEFVALLMGATADPSAPAAGKLKMYAHDVGGRIMPKWVGPAGLHTAVQPAFFQNGMMLISPGTTTAFSVVGTGTLTAIGTVSHPAIATGTLREQTRRGIITSAGTANAASELRFASMSCYRGENVGGVNLGGFFLVIRFAVSSSTANQRCACGLWASTGATSTSQSPSSLTNCILVGWDSADSNLQVMHNDGADACTKIDLGSSFPANTPNAVYELALFCAPNSSAVGYRVKRLDAPASAAGSLTTNLPNPTELLAWHAYANNGGTAAAVVLEIMRIYLETDY